MKKIFLYLLIAPLLAFSQQETKREYYPSGRLLSIINYTDGVSNGSCKYFHDYGAWAIKTSLNYKNGKLIGSSKTYNQNGTLIETVEKSSLGVQDFPFTYSYFPGNNKLNLYDDDIIEPSNLDFITYGDIIFTIIEHTSDNLTCEWTDISEGDNETYRGYFDKVN